MNASHSLALSFQFQAIKKALLGGFALTLRKKERDSKLLHNIVNVVYGSLQKKIK